MAEGLVGGEGFAVDPSLIEADANKQRSVLSHEWDINDLPANATRADGARIDHLEGEKGLGGD